MSQSLHRTLCLPVTLHSAWKVVKSKNSAGGIDGLSVGMYEERLKVNLEELRRDLIDKKWNPEPYLKVEIEKKGSAETRKLGMLSVRDKIVQQAIKSLIELFRAQAVGKMVRAKRIFCIVAYDISDNRQRSRVVKILEKHGVRVNFSVFECMFTEVQFAKVQKAIEAKIDTRDDTVIYYPVCVNCYTKIIYQPARKKSVRTVEIC